MKYDYQFQFSMVSTKCKWNTNPLLILQDWTRVAQSKGQFGLKSLGKKGAFS